MSKPYELVNFCEIDKYAAKSYCAVHDVDPAKNLGDITKVDENKLPEFNCIFGGSPCQDFSVAGKGAGSMWKCRECGMSTILSQCIGLSGTSVLSVGVSSLIRRAHLCL